MGRVQNGEGVSQAIVEVHSDRAIGLMWVALRPQPHAGGMGYWIVPSKRGRGVATGAVRLVVPWALDALELGRLEAWVQPGNPVSQRVLRSAGLQQEGRLRNFLNIEGGVGRAGVLSPSARAMTPKRTHMPRAARTCR